MHASLLLSRQHLKEMIRHAESRVPLEACGLIAGRGNRVEAVLPVENAEQSPVRFRMNPYGQLRAFEWIEARGLDLVGIFHSHPAGPEATSPTDIAEAVYPVIHVVLSPRQKTWQARGFWIEAGRAVEIQLQVE